MGLNSLLWARPSRALLLAGAAVCAKTLFLAVAAWAIAPDFGGRVWSSPLGVASLLGTVVLAPPAAGVLYRHVRARARIRRRNAPWSGDAAGAGGLAAPPRHTPPPAAGAPPPTAPPPAEGARTLPPTARVVPPAAPATPMIESVDWAQRSCAAPGLARLRVRPSPAAEGARSTLRVRLVDSDGLALPGEPDALPLAPGTREYGVVVPPEARRTHGVWAVVTVGGRAEPETHRAGPLLIVGGVSFWVGPRWSHESCAEGDEVTVGAAADGAPPGTPVQVTIQAVAIGPSRDGDRLREEELASFDVLLDADRSFLVRWRARRAAALHDQADYLGWEPPRYRATVSLVGHVDMTGDLAISPRGRPRGDG